MTIRSRLAQAITGIAGALLFFAGAADAADGADAAAHFRLRAAMTVAGLPCVRPGVV